MAIKVLHENATSELFNRGVVNEFRREAATMHLLGHNPRPTIIPPIPSSHFVVNRQPSKFGEVHWCVQQYIRRLAVYSI